MRRTPRAQAERTKFAALSALAVHPATRRMVERKLNPPERAQAPPRQRFDHSTLDRMFPEEATSEDGGFFGKPWDNERWYATGDRASIGAGPLSGGFYSCLQPHRGQSPEGPHGKEYWKLYAQS